jgi:hypothetical protein
MLITAPMTRWGISMGFRSAVLFMHVRMYMRMCVCVRVMLIRALIDEHGMRVSLEMNPSDGDISLPRCMSGCIYVCSMHACDKFSSSVCMSVLNVSGEFLGQVGRLLDVESVLVK